LNPLPPEYEAGLLATHCSVRLKLKLFAFSRIKIIKCHWNKKQIKEFIYFLNLIQHGERQIVFCDGVSDEQIAAQTITTAAVSTIN
jgi:hypothetical protein